MRNADEKRNLIIESAKKRFSHFGMAKTTMAEIAKDLSFSKALLYYYFPDKNSLYIAVFDHIMDELVESTSVIIEKGDLVEKTIFAVLDERVRFIRDYFNIFEYTYSLRLEMPSDLQELLPSVFEKERKQMAKMLEKGVARGELAIDNIEDIAKILLISLLGARLGLLKEFKSIFVPPTKEETDQILDMQKKLAKIFIDGLRVR